ncbi:MAG: DUF177 domain-containing protein [bacterium]
MRVRIDDLPPEGRSFSIEVPIAELDRAVQPDRDPGLAWNAPAQAEIALHKAGRSLRIHGDARFSFTEPCARCLVEVERSTRSTIDLTKLLGAAPDQPRTHELREDEIDEDYLDAPEIDLDEVVLEQIVLDLPQRVLCSDSCRGLCPSCGVNLNLAACSCQPSHGDPRFAVLAKLFPGEPPAES